MERLLDIPGRVQEVYELAFHRGQELALMLLQERSDLGALGPEDYDDIIDAVVAMLPVDEIIRDYREALQ